MPLLQGSLNAIGRLPKETRVAVLGAVLDHCSSDEAADAACLLLDEAADERSRGLVLTEIARRWRRLSPGVRRRAIEQGKGEWTRIVVSMATDLSASVRASAASLAGDAKEPGGVGLIVSLLRDSDTTVASAAEAALIACANGLNACSDPAYRRAVERGVAAAAEGVADHRRTAGVLGALSCILGDPRLLSAPDGSLRALLEDEGHPLHLSWRGWIRKNDGDGALGRAWVWSHLPPVASACAERLRGAGESGGPVDDAASVQDRWYLIAHPGRRAVVRRLREQSPDALRTLVEGGGEGRGPLTRSGAVLLARAAGVSGEMREGVCCAGVIDGHASVRYAALRWMAATSPGSGPIAADAEYLTDQCFDGSEVVACSALRAVRRPVWRDAVGTERLGRIARLMQRSPAKRARALAAWEAGEQSGTVARVRERIAVRRATRRPGGDAAATMQRAIQNWREKPDAAECAMCAAAGINLGTSVASEIVSLTEECTGSDPAESRLRACAVRSLGAASGGAFESQIERLLDDGDTRVRCNAMESLAACARRRGGEHAAGLVADRFLADADHRIRGAAVDIGLRAAGTLRCRAGETLLEMLADARPMHRVAGVWAAQRSASRIVPARAGSHGWAESAGSLSAVVDAVSALVTNDPSPALRARAMRCAARLLGAMRAGLSGRVGTGVGGRPREVVA